MMQGNIEGRTVYSLGFIIAAALGFALLWPHPAASRAARVPARRATGGPILLIAGNPDGRGGSFPHQKHVEALGGKSSCPGCHHMNLPKAQATGCYQCHRDMYAASEEFGHDWHASPSGGKLSCVECHPAGQARVAGTAKQCAGCHKELAAQAAARSPGFRVRSYTEATHLLCAGCHS